MEKSKTGRGVDRASRKPDPDELFSGSIRIVEKIGFNEGCIQLRIGSETKTGMILIRPGDLVVSGINAAKGSIAIYNESNVENVAATIHYGAYIENESIVEIKFLWWLLRSSFFRELLMLHVPGGIKTELKAKRLLSVPVPLPPIAEQRRIVARIDALAAQISEARSLRQQVNEEIEALVISTHMKLAGGRSRTLKAILELDEDKVPILPTGSYPQVGVRSFGGGLFPKAAVAGIETTYKTFNRLYEGALLLSQVKGWEGAVAVCPSALAGLFVSPEYRTFRCRPSESRPDYMATLIRTEWFWGRLTNATRGVGARRERTRPEQFLALEIPMPDVRSQGIAEQIFVGLNEIKQLHAETAAELDALMLSILDRAFKGEL